MAQAPATAPATTNPIEPAATAEREVIRLRRHVEALRAEIARLKRELAVANGGGPDGRALGAATALNRAGEYVTTHRLTPEVAAAVGEFRPTVGMTEEALRLLVESQNDAGIGAASLALVAESASDKTYDVTLVRRGDAPSGILAWVDRVTIAGAEVRSVVVGGVHGGHLNNRYPDQVYLFFGAEPPTKRR